MLYLNFYARRGCAERIAVGDDVNAAVLTRRRNERREVSHASEQCRRQVLKLIRCFSHSPNCTLFSTSSMTCLPRISPPFSFKTLSAAKINRAARGRTFGGWISSFAMNIV